MMSEERETTTTPALDLDAIEARANAATPGPWVQSQRDMWMVYRDGGGTPEIDVGGGYDIKEDATFIAAARSDVPALVAEVRRLARWLRMIADRPDAEMQQAKTLHWDMRGWARYALDGIEAPAIAPQRAAVERDDMGRANAELQERLNRLRAENAALRESLDAMTE
jgi:hypothetical protein